MQNDNELAVNASYQAFVNCYLREVDSGVWHDIQQWPPVIAQAKTKATACCGYIELQLSALKKTLLLTVDYRSLAGRHRLAQPYLRHAAQSNWQSTDPLSVILLLVEALYTTPDGQIKNKQPYLELLNRLTQSIQLMHGFLTSSYHDSHKNSAAFIHAEQSIVFGHWLHPAPKSRQGMHDWQHAYYSPEMKGHFALHFFTAPVAMIQASSHTACCVNSTLLHIATHGDMDGQAVLKQQLANTGRGLLAVHPLQAQWLLHQTAVLTLIDDGVLHDLGTRGARFTPTSSVRTLYSESLDVMIKVSIPVKVTNSLRVNKQHELEAGPVLSKLITAIGLHNFTDAFRILDDPGYITLVPTSEHSESGFELIVRQNPFYTPAQLPAATTEQTLAALVQEPPFAKEGSRLAQLVQEHAQMRSKSLFLASLAWFDAYWNCAIEPMIRLYNDHGIGLEAHQQNSVIRTLNGLPVTYFYRDNQGYYLALSSQDALISMVPALRHCLSLFYDDEMIIQRFSYYLFINQLFGVINRFGSDGLLNESTLLHQTRNRLLKLQSSLHQRGKRLICYLLESETLACKGNLLTRVEDVDELEAELELAVYTSMPNPLHISRLTASNQTSLLTEHEVIRELA